MRTIENVRAAGRSTCSGGIIGMGESDDDILDSRLRDPPARNRFGAGKFLAPIEGTPLADTPTLTPERCLKAARLFRLLNLASELRAAGGRETNLAER